VVIHSAAPRRDQVVIRSLALAVIRSLALAVIHSLRSS